MSIPSKIKTAGRYLTAGSLAVAGVNPNIAFNAEDKARNAAVGDKIKSEVQSVKRYLPIAKTAKKIVRKTGQVIGAMATYKRYNKAIDERQNMEDEIDRQRLEDRKKEYSLP